MNSTAPSRSPWPAEPPLTPASSVTSPGHLAIVWKANNARFLEAISKSRSKTQRKADIQTVLSSALRSLTPPQSSAIPSSSSRFLSPSTASTDRITKNQEYRNIPSVQRYIMIEQDKIAATVFARVAGDWIGHILFEDAILSMPEIGIELPLAELYKGISLDVQDNFEEPPQTA